MTGNHHRARSAHQFPLVKVTFPLSPEDAQAGVSAENLWAIELPDGHYRLDNIPFYAYGVSLDDVVEAKLLEGRLVFQRVVQRGGHSTYRVLVEDARGHESPAFRRMWSELQTLGCSFEVAKTRWIAIDVPPTTDVFAVYSVLKRGEANRIWSFEEAHCGHPV